MTNSVPVINVVNTSVNFFLRKQKIEATQGVSFALHSKETLAIVGESGSGKSVSILALLGLLPPHAQVISDGMFYRENNLYGMDQLTINTIRGKHIGYVPQEPSRSYDPLCSIRSTFDETLRAHNTNIHKDEVETIAVKTLSDVGIEEPHKRLDNFFHQFSGGMIQRVMIALALSLQPSVIIADEPTTALDVITQRRLINILEALKEKYSLSLIFITHDIALASEFTDRFLVMKDGKVVEEGDREKILSNPQKEYTKQLLDSIITIDSPSYYEETRT